MQQEVIFLDCYDSAGRVPADLTGEHRMRSLTLLAVLALNPRPCLATLRIGSSLLNACRTVMLPAQHAGCGTPEVAEPVAAAADGRGTHPQRQRPAGLLTLAVPSHSLGLMRRVTIVDMSF